MCNQSCEIKTVYNWRLVPPVYFFVLSIFACNSVFVFRTLLPVCGDHLWHIILLTGVFSAAMCVFALRAKRMMDTYATGACMEKKYSLKLERDDQVELFRYTLTRRGITGVTTNLVSTVRTFRQVMTSENLDDPKDICGPQYVRKQLLYALYLQQRGRPYEHVLMAHERGKPDTSLLTIIKKTG